MRHEGFVGAALDDFATVNDENIVRMTDGFQAVGDYDDGFLFGQGFDGRGEFLFAFRVNIGGLIFSIWLE